MKLHGIREKDTHFSLYVLPMQKLYWLPKIGQQNKHFNQPQNPTKYEIKSLSNKPIY